MTAKDFIISELQKLVAIFPAMSFGYRFDRRSSTHIIGVKPLEDYQSNKQYSGEESRIIYDFSNTYLTESILFVSDESLVKIANPEFVVKAADYVVVSNVETTYKPVTYKIACHAECSGNMALSGENNYALAA